MHGDSELSEYESHIEAYESQLAADATSVRNLRDYLPPSSSEAVRVRVLVELLRITLEHQWSRGDRYAIDRFRDDYPDVFTQSDVLGPLAFEEYRLRIQSGESVSPSDFSSRYGVDVAAWPELQPDEERWRSFANDAPEDASRLERACRSLPNVGESFEGFTLLSELGRGAFARVFLARQESLAGRLVALKVTAGPTVEPRRMARLQHGNIVPIYSVHVLDSPTDSLTGVCMPFLGCATLADVVRGAWHPGRNRAAMPASGRSIVSTLAARRSIVSTFAGETTVQMELHDDAVSTSPASGARLLDQMESDSYVSAVVRLAVRVAEGLAHAHVRGIVHRDLKPANILLADDGEPLILDFNLSEELGPAAGGAALVGGTLPYMSPEQLEALGAKRRADCPVVDARSDLFSLGVVLHELLTGRLPRELTRGSVDSVAAGLRRAWNEPLKSLGEWNPAVAPGLAAIVAKCLELNPARRYANARELAEDLDRHLNHRPLRYAPNRSWRERLTKWARRHPRLSSATGVGMASATVVALAIGAWAARGVQLERAEAAARRRAFQDELPQARVRLAPGVQTAEPAIARHGIQYARRLLDQYQFTANPRWREQPAVQRLAPDERTQLENDLAELAGLLAVVEATNESQPDSARADSPLATAMALCRERRYAEAAGRLELIVARDPRDAAAWLALGYCHVRLNDLAQAEIDYSMCRALSPRLYVAVYFRGLARLEMKRHAAAYDDFCETLQLAPATPEAHFHRGLAAQALRKHAEAVADFDRALELGFRHTRIFFLRARSQGVLGHVDAAARDRQLGFDETPADSLSYVARALERLGRDAVGARIDLEAALALDPDSAVARANLAHVLSERLGEKEAALGCLDQWIKSYPKDALAWGSRAVLQAREGRTDDALRDADEALRWSQAPFTRYQAACAIALVARGEASRLERARKLIAQALEEEPALALDMRHDPDLAALRSDMRFARLIGAALVLVEESKVEHGK